MYKVLIVDDENIVHQGMETLHWDRLGACVVGNAYDGEEAEALFKSEHPDIVITDICMAKKNGLKLIESIRAARRATKIIILTAYANFEVAQKALNYGVDELLLKPISPEKLEATLSKLISSIALEKKKIQLHMEMESKIKNMIPLLREKIISDLLDNEITSDEQLKICDFASGKYIVAMIQSDDYSTYNVFSLFEQLKTDLELTGFNFFLMRGIKKMCCVLYTQSYIPDDVFLEEVSIFFAEKIKYCLEMFSIGFTVGLSDVVQNIMDLHKARVQSEKAISQKFSLGDNMVLYYSDIKNDLYSTAGRDLFKSKFLKTFVTGHSEDIQKTFAEYVNSVYSSVYPNESAVKINVYDTIFKCIELISNNYTIDNSEFKKLTKLIEIQDISVFFQSSEEFIVNISNQAMSATQHTHQDLIDKCYQIIELEYNEQITLSYISQKLNYSATYLGRLIKKHTNKSFSDILTDKRIAVAKEKLTTTNLLISQVAEQSGFIDSSYFAQVFKKNTGVTPLEYRSITNI